MVVLCSSPLTVCIGKLAYHNAISLLLLTCADVSSATGAWQQRVLHD
jgi:hypothetical protein